MSDDPRFQSVQRRSVERLRAQIIRYDQMIAEYEDSTGRHPDDTPISPDELPNVFAARDRAFRELRVVETQLILDSRQVAGGGVGEANRARRANLKAPANPKGQRVNY